jgi:hypothetical protein
MWAEGKRLLAGVAQDSDDEIVTKSFRKVSYFAAGSMLILPQLDC